VYTLQAKPDDSQWKKIQMALARLSLKSATVENEKLVIVLSGSHAVLTALGFIGAACIVGLMIFGLASAGIIF
jgi:hypothetical protein